MRPRKTDRHLPACVYQRRGSYWHVKAGKWTPLGVRLPDALAEYARIVAQPAGGVGELIDKAFPAITKKVTPSTRERYLVSAVKIKEALIEFRPEDVRHGDVVQMLDPYIDHASIGNRMLTVLKMTYNWALDRGLVELNPCASVKRLETHARERLPTMGEYKAVHAKAGKRLQCIMDLCYLTGQRIGDVLKIRRADLLEEGIYFEQQKHKFGKPAKRLIVAWSPELRAAVDRAKAITGSVAPLTLFYARGGTPNHANVWRQFKRAAALAAVENITLHDLRAMSGTAADAQGIDPQKLLGHTSAQTTRIYLRDKSAKVVSGPSFNRVLPAPPTNPRKSKA